MFQQTLKGEMGMDKTCGATIEFGDDEGDNICTFHCTLPKGHDGLHRECGAGDFGGSGVDVSYTVTWEEQDD